MGKLVIHPDLRTIGGEMNDLMLDGIYVGSMTLNYREGNRMVGSVQLDAAALDAKDKDEVLHDATEYIQALIDAYEIAECHVIVTHSNVDHVIATKETAGLTEVELESGQDSISWDHRPDQGKREPARYLELVIVGEHQNTVEYHIYDRNMHLQTEVFVSILDRDVVGEMNWQFRPSDEFIEQATDLLVSDFDEQKIDTFILEMKYNEELLEIVELTHDNLFTKEDSDEPNPSDDYSVILTRDDGDVLTYEIYDHTRGGLSIAAATVDISRKELSGYIDFREEEDEELREEIAVQLMRELDKEKDYDIINLTMMHNNEWIDEMVFEQSSSAH